MEFPIVCKKNQPKAKRSVLAFYVYFNYFVWGSSIILVSQFHSWFMELWHTDLKGISIVISMLGLGHLITVLLAGWFSDKFGRKNTIIIGTISNIIFLMGLLVSRNIWMASICSLFLGNANSFNDSGSYPLLTEKFPEKPASMNALVKASMSLSQTILPLVIAAVHSAYIIIPAMAVMLGLLLLKVSVTNFGKNETIVKETVSEQKEILETSTNKPSVLIDGVGMVILGFTLSFIFYMYSQYAPVFAEKVIGSTPVFSKTLISWYAISSLISVFITSTVVRKVHPFKVLLTYSIVAAAMLIVMVVHPTPTIARLTSIAIGFFAAGGIWQVGLTILSRYFPREKGRVTGYYSFAAALTYFVGPIVSTFILDDTAASLVHVFVLDVAVSVLGIIIMIILAVRCFKYKFI